VIHGDRAVILAGEGLTEQALKEISSRDSGQSPPGVKRRVRLKETGDYCYH
jgi:hypothetical protein